ncbi:hypothetical protein [Streptomyces sp. bgisy095]|uniref:hypothetical protein n=1 Tax=unclassified Streptomyces TaxID=2593676 RepID=UPI003D73B0FE
MSRDPDPGLNKGKAKPLYQLLLSYADVSDRTTEKGYPYRAALADALDCTVDTIDTATKYLERDIGLIRVDRRKVPGSAENDANNFVIYDQWLIQGCEPTPDTPPQLVARYGATIPGFDVDAWISEHAPSFDLAAWRAKYEATVAAQEAKRAEQRRKAALRRKGKGKKKEEGGSGTESATPEAEEEGGGSGMSAATGSGTESATGSGMSAALSTSVPPDTSSTADPAPPARSAGDARRATTGSSAREGEGGSAASKDKSSAPKKGTSGSGVRMSRAQAEAVRTVEAGLPAELVPLLPKHRPAVVRDALLAAVSGRTADQIVARVERRWLAWGYSLAAMDGEIKSPVGVLVRLLEHGKCGDPMCEDGTALDTGAACRECEVRRADRRREFKRSKGEGVPSQRPAAGRERWVCVDCGRPGPGPGPADGVCADCTAAVAASAAAFRQKLAEDAEQKRAAAEADQRRAAELEAEMERERQEQAAAEEAEEAARLAAEQAHAAEADEETARLRAQIIAENPWMAQYAAKPPQAATAPF